MKDADAIISRVALVKSRQRSTFVVAGPSASLDEAVLSSRLMEPFVDDLDCLLPHKRVVRLVERRLCVDPVSFSFGAF